MGPIECVWVWVCVCVRAREPVAGAAAADDEHAYDSPPPYLPVPFFPSL
jgi:hypothetical protein